MTATTKLGKQYPDHTKLLDAAEAFFEALKRDAPAEEIRDIIKDVSIPPRKARRLKQRFGKEFVLGLGFDLSKANSEFGEGWLDEPEEEE